MAIEDQITQDLTPGMRLTILGAAKRYQVSYSTAQKGLRKLWRAQWLTRRKVDKILEYEGRQERLV
jgi:DNA-binding GntR family transcriptional regulator